MRVYIHSNYSYPDLFRQTPSLSGCWEDIEFTYHKVKECDYLVVINHPTEDINIRCRKGGRILIIQEPPYQRNNYLTSYFEYFDIIITAFDKKYSKNILQIPAGLPWLIDKSYDELKSLPSAVEHKMNKASWVTSNSVVNPGHQPRLDFLEQVRESGLDVELFGRGIRSINNKFDGLYPYKYSFAVENYSDKDYWTEKLADAYLSWTMPIYYGCTNIESYFPAGSFLRIDISRPGEAIDLIRNAMDSRMYEKNIAAIREARELILNKYQFFPLVSGLIKKIPVTEKYQDTFIPAVADSPGLLKKIKLLLKR